ncbi:MAG: glycoside hydrolase family 5 protein [Paludibacteraceae bacterium]|nr:glycoside hydrolase family 5 protein [Paludibacteraceae bacterium]
MKKLILSTLALAATAVNAQNLIEVTLKDGSVKTFQTSSIENVRFTQGDSFSITDDEGLTTTFDGTVSNIKFSKHHAIDGTSVHTIAHSIGLGWNLGNSLDAHNYGNASETAWGNPESTLNTFIGVKNAGFSAVRIPVTWLGHIGSAPEYKIEESYMEHVAKVVGYAKEAGLKVIVNIHHDGANSQYWLDVLGSSKDENKNNQVKAQLSAMWKQIAERFKREGDYLIFEGMNEIHDGGWGWGQNLTDGGAQYRVMNEWLQTFVDAVRSVGGENTYRYLGCPGYDTNVDHTINEIKVPTDVVDDKLLVAVHFYDPYTYTLNNEKDEWGHTGVNKENWGDEDNVTNIFSRLKTKFMDNNIPVYLGEFGNVHRSTDRAEAFRKYYLEYVCKAASDYDLPLFFWDNGGKGFGAEQSGLIDHGTGEYINNGKDVIDVMVRGFYNEDPGYTLESVYNNAPR